ncbi:MAG: TetR/AcrR family transcriptional regulator [Terracidiphilus sp.]
MTETASTSERIYQCALAILEDEGPQAVSMRRIAREIGITPMAIYHHFPSREALLDKVVDTEFERLAGFFRQPVKGSTAAARIVHIMDGYMDYALAHPRIFDYVFASPRPGARRFPEDFRARGSPTLNVVADALRDWMKTGELKRDDVWELAMALWAHAHGYLALYRGGRFNLTEDQFRKLVRRSLRRFFHGLKA